MSEQVDGIRLLEQRREPPPSEVPLDGGLVRLVRENAAAWPALLLADDARERPNEGRWSALEYGCHVRDVFRLFEQRLRMMLTEDGPDFENWDQDATAVEERYDEQDPAAVSAEIVAAGEPSTRVTVLRTSTTSTSATLPSGALPAMPLTGIWRKVSTESMPTSETRSCASSTLPSSSE